MRKTSTIGTALKTFCTLFATLALMIGCQKDEVQPIIPGDDTTPATDTIPPVVDNSNYFVCNGDTTAITDVVLMYLETYWETMFMLENGCAVELIGNYAPTTGSCGFTSMMAVFYGSADCVGVYYSESKDETFSQGSLTTTVKGDNYEYEIEATTEYGNQVSLHYCGPIIDITQPTGEGTLTIDNERYDLDRAMAMNQDGYYSYSMMDGSLNTNVDISSKVPLTNSNFTIISGRENSADEVYVMLNVSTELDYIDGYLTSGTLSTTLNGDQYLITISGDSEFGPISCQFAGSISKTLLKKKFQDISRRSHIKPIPRPIR